MNRFLLLLPLIWTCKSDVVQPRTQKSEGPVVSVSTPGQTAASATIKFSGYTWTVKSGAGMGPGPNTWAEQNAWVDAGGLLHLKVSYNSATSKWLCAGITSTENFGYGTYQWQVQGPVSTLDKNIVAGLFHYSGPDGYNELDVEFARWGDSAKPNVNYSVYPAAGTTGKQQRITTEWAQSGGTASTHRYIWTENSVVVKSMNGFYNDDTNLFFTHTFVPPLSVIPTAKMPVKMNLWCFRGLAPSDGKEVEIVIRSFKFTPAS
ncbi:Glycosyl hydrolases family 16 [Pedobacter sp. ok626]|uniref:glycoside hydrolase family 16 protein n=1 Tax=Pedobacter sp. ok626 TaxID=1761882 RepID=UPI00088ADFD6|nr:glycoside hydrolase family 16 protein [Pedobacter sp. ok626]SDJ05901.1 Glycosyl hydrolases family 16 [Pedobacter sp. ok626]